MNVGDAETLAAAWVRAWSGDDVTAVIGLLHDDATIADPDSGKVRADAIPAYVRGALARERSAITHWHVRVGVDSVAVVASYSDGGESVDTLVVADGKIVRAMRHR